MIRILIADDHPLVRTGLRQILARHEDMSVLGEAEDYNGILAHLRDTEYDVILLDVWDSNQAEARSLAEVERWHIERTLVVHEGNRTWAARELGISRATLIKKIKSYGLPVAKGSAHMNPTSLP